LGTEISVNGKIDTENNRVQKAKQVYYQINETIVGKKESKNNTKIRAEVMQGTGRPRIKWGKHMQKQMRKREELSKRQLGW